MSHEFLERESLSCHVRPEGILVDESAECLRVGCHCTLQAGDSVAVGLLVLRVCFEETFYELLNLV
eukprot:5519941-Amphidinium_carterae.1